MLLNYLFLYLSNSLFIGAYAFFYWGVCLFLLGRMPFFIGAYAIRPYGITI